MTIHAHIDNASQDCDGPVYRSRVEAMTDAERAGEFSEIHFRERVLLSEISVYAVQDATLNVDANGFYWSENTDEGYRSATVRWCNAPCDLGEKSYRDVYAEQMGY